LTPVVHAVQVGWRWPGRVVVSRWWRVHLALAVAVAAACGVRAVPAQEPFFVSEPALISPAAAAVPPLLAISADEPHLRNKPPNPLEPSWEAGWVSWYGKGFQGRKTASGERFDARQLTAAHRTFRFGTRVRVRNPENGLEVTVRINDHGPNRHDRMIDLSRAAADAIGLAQRGVMWLEITPVPVLAQPGLLPVLRVDDDEALSARQNSAPRSPSPDGPGS
jgi:rare lipoprotein A